MNVDTILLHDVSNDEIHFPVAVHRVLPEAVLGDLISEHPFFADLDGQHIGILAKLAMETRFEPGQFVFKKGDLANRFYLIMDGAVEIDSGQGNDVIQRLGAGDELGWSWLFEPHYFQFTAQAVTPIKAIFFYGTILRQHCEDDHDFGYEVTKRVGRVMVKDWMAFQKSAAHSRTLSQMPDTV
jgi:CRP/FNR family cyclic AMP-dependent transcriptional regulator